MQKVLLVLSIAVLFTACKQQKTAYVDVADIMKEYKAVKTLEKEVEDQQNALQAKYNQIAMEFEKEAREFDASSRRMSRKKAEARYQELLQKNQQIQQAQQAESATLQQESQESMDEIIEDFKDFVKEYAQANGYTYILGATESGNVLYGDATLDLTEEILDALNKDYKENNKSEETTESDDKKVSEEKPESVEKEAE